MPPFLRLLVVCLTLGAAALPADPDRQSRPLEIGPGASPALAVDPDRRTLHLVYRHEGRLLHREGDFSGRFGPSDLLFATPSSAPGLWEPRIVLDGTGRPHAVWSDGHYQNRFVWYARRNADGWSAPLVVFDKTAHALDRATLPHLAVSADGTTAWIGAFTVGGPAKGEGDEWGILARIDNVDTTPAVSVRRRILAWNPQLALLDGDLWVGGRNIRTPDRQFALQRFDPATLEPREPAFPLSGSRHGEIGRLAVDAAGDLHAAGTLNRAESSAVAGWYQSLARARAGLPALTYLTSNRNASGAGLPVPDARTPGRVYVLHWHGTLNDEDHEPAAGATGNFLHYVRFENGTKAVEGRRLGGDTAPHGHSYRHTPCAAPHPDGGFFAIVQESGTPDGLTFVTVGVTP